MIQRAMRDPEGAMLSLGFGQLSLRASFPVSMSGSGRSFTAYVFAREAPALRRAADSAVARPVLWPVATDDASPVRRGQAGHQQRESGVEPAQPSTPGNESLQLSPPDNESLQPPTPDRGSPELPLVPAPSTDGNLGRDTSPAATASTTDTRTAAEQPVLQQSDATAKPASKKASVRSPKRPIGPGEVDGPVQPTGLRRSLRATSARTAALPVPPVVGTRALCAPHVSQRTMKLRVFPLSSFTRFSVCLLTAGAGRAGGHEADQTGGRGRAGGRQAEQARSGIPTRPAWSEPNVDRCNCAIMTRTDDCD